MELTGGISLDVPELSDRLVEGVGVRMTVGLWSPLWFPGLKYCARQRHAPLPSFSPPGFITYSHPFCQHPPLFPSSRSTSSQCPLDPHLGASQSPYRLNMPQTEPVVLATLNLSYLVLSRFAKRGPSLLPPLFHLPGDQVPLMLIPGTHPQNRPPRPCHRCGSRVPRPVPSLPCCQRDFSTSCFGPSIAASSVHSPGSGALASAVWCAISLCQARDCSSLGLPLPCACICFLCPKHASSPFSPMDACFLLMELAQRPPSSPLWLHHPPHSPSLSVQTGYICLGPHRHWSAHWRCILVKH